MRQWQREVDLEWNLPGWKGPGLQLNLLKYLLCHMVLWIQQRDRQEHTDFVLIIGQALPSLRSSLLSHSNTWYNRQVALPPGDSFLVYRMDDCSNWIVLRIKMS